MTQRLIYYTDSDVFLADSLDLPDISDFFAKRLTPASAPPLGPGGAPPCGFNLYHFFIS